ncbi:hypothetical protein ACJX0J_011124, partial [Zea mays]
MKKQPLGERKKGPQDEHIYTAYGLKLQKTVWADYMFTLLMLCMTAIDLALLFDMFDLVKKESQDSRGQYIALVLQDHNIIPVSLLLLVVVLGQQRPTLRPTVRLGSAATYLLDSFHTRLGRRNDDRASVLPLKVCAS